MISTVGAVAKPTTSTRTCGAIAVRNVLQRFGVERSVESIWAAVARPDPFGTLAARSYRLAAYALTCGLEAVTVQCRSERWPEALHRLCEQKLAVILNHGAVHARDEGHYSVLTNIDANSVELDDPFKGPGQRLSLESMHALWQRNRESVGFVLVAIRPGLSGQQLDAGCETPRCPGCDTRLPLSPNPLFVERDWQAGGLWKRFYCHGCDAGFAPQA